MIVDFKTDRIASWQLHERSEQYRTQLEAYAAALERVMERPVREKILLARVRNKKVTIYAFFYVRKAILHEKQFRHALP